MRTAIPGLRATRRGIIGGIGAFALAPALGARAAASVDDSERHGLSYFGDLALAPDFAHLPYVEPTAPKGGRLQLVPSEWRWNQNPETFNSLNTLILRGEAPVGMELTMTSLLLANEDEPDAMYGLAARSVRVRDDGNTIVFRLRPEARFHDGSPITPEDVSFSLTTLKAKGHPLISQVVREMVAAEVGGVDEVVVRFSGKQSRGLPLIVAGLPIISKAWYATRSFEDTTLEPTLGSGPYKVGRFEPGQYIEYDRVQDWWAKDLPICRGQFNFDVIRYDFYRERTASFEAFKSGAYLLREEFTSLTWATQYDFPAFKEGRVVRFELPDDTPSGAQGWFLNLRRKQFQDPRAREALSWLFDYEWTNRNIFFGSYKRTASFFEVSNMKAEGPPSPEELAILEPYRGQVPDEVFGEPWVPPVSDGSGQDRRLLRRAVELFAAAGWTTRDGALRNAAGEPFTIEFLDSDTSFNRVSEPYVRNLKRLGIEASIRIVDSAQFQKRVQEFDFDTVVRRYSMSLTPDEGMRLFWGSDAARTPGSSNLAGIADPVIDALIDRAIKAPDRATLTVTIKCIDRLLRAGRYWVPHWHKPSHWIAMWDVYDRPPKKPKRGRGIDNTWWLDRAKAERLGKGL